MAPARNWAQVEENTARAAGKRPLSVIAEARGVRAYSCDAVFFYAIKKTWPVAR
ncbi:MAG: hypothetical protein ACLUI3_10810 [Christensenellales bacterium]